MLGGTTLASANGLDDLFDCSRIRSSASTSGTTMTTTRDGIANIVDFLTMRNHGGNASAHTMLPASKCAQIMIATIIPGLRGMATIATIIPGLRGTAVIATGVEGKGTGAAFSIRSALLP